MYDNNSPAGVDTLRVVNADLDKGGPGHRVTLQQWNSADSFTSSNYIYDHTGALSSMRKWSEHATHILTLLVWITEID
ncbi:hypothetical protein CHS0354_016009, partial [Potamilus streckersoni]